MTHENSHSGSGKSGGIGALAHAGHGAGGGAVLHGHDDGHGGEDHGDGDTGAVHVHIASSRFYLGIFSALIVLTVLTVRVSYYDFGQANIIIALLIATLKASLVAAFFMHLRHDKLFNTVAFLAAFLFLAIFILLTYDDMGTRAKTTVHYTDFIDSRTGLAAPGGEPATTATSNSVDEAPPKAGEHGEPAGAGKEHAKE
jgi:cytochrome c oxidase subunit 4